MNAFSNYLCGQSCNCSVLITVMYGYLPFTLPKVEIEHIFQLPMRSVHYLFNFSLCNVLLAPIYPYQKFKLNTFSNYLWFNICSISAFVMCCYLQFTPTKSLNSFHFQTNYAVGPVFAQFAPSYFTASSPLLY